MAYPTLNANEINNALFNQIISQQIFERISEVPELVDKARVDGSLFGDTKTYFAADIIGTHAFVQDSADALNLLAVDRNKTVKTQAIVLDIFRQCSTTIDELLSKRAWQDEGTFAMYNDLLAGMISKAKYIYDTTTYDAFIGTVTSAVGKQSPSAYTLTSGKEGQEIGQHIADIIADMKHPSRDYNDYGHLTKFGEGEIKIVWNSKWVNKIEKIDLPVIFHNEKLIAKFAENVVHKDYFGDVKALADISASSVSVGKPIKVSGGVYTFEPDDEETMVLRVLEEVDLYDSADSSKTTPYHFFAGEQLVNPTGKKLVVTDLDNKLYAQNDKIICKIFVKLPAYMSAFELGTSFYNPKNHSTNRYLTFGRNTLAAFKAYPVVTIKSN